MAAPSNRTLQTALALAKAGISVFPCKENKAPATRRGFKDASCDPEVIKGWFAKPGRLIGIPTGKTNDLFVVDVDPNGLEWLNENQAELDSKCVHSTRRGKHLLYRYPSDGASLKNTAGRLALGVDTRGEGGYIIWWPAEGLPVEGAFPRIGDPPEWLIEALDSKPAVGSTSEREYLPIEPGVTYEGGRNQALASFAGSLNRRGVKGAELEQHLKLFNQRNCSPPLPDEEVAAIAKSVSRYASEAPISPLARPPKPVGTMQDFMLSKEEVEKIQRTKWVIEDIAPQSHVVVIVGAPGAGKTTIMFHLCCLISDEYVVNYIHADTNPGDAKDYYERAWKHGVNYATPDMVVGKSMEDVMNFLRAKANGAEELYDQVFVIDTLKKTANMIDKDNLKKATQVFRKLSSRGATLLLLGHTNKHKNNEGDFVFEGTQDLRADVDEMIFLIPHKEPDGSLLVSTKVDKQRSEMKERSFRIHEDRTVEVLEEWTNVSRLVEQEKQRKKDKPIVDAIRDAILHGTTLKGQITSHCSNLGLGGPKAINKVLHYYSNEGEDPIWRIERFPSEKNAIRYKLIDDFFE